MKKILIGVGCGCIGGAIVAVLGWLFVVAPMSNELQGNVEIVEKLPPPARTASAEVACVAAEIRTFTDGFDFAHRQTRPPKPDPVIKNLQHWAERLERTYASVP